MIKILVLFFFTGTAHLTLVDLEDPLEPRDQVNEAEFEELFQELADPDPEVEKARADALKAREKVIQETNKEYLEGKKSWFDGLDAFSNLPEDEFEAERTGALEPEEFTRATGLLIHPVELQYDEASERYFDQFRYSRADIPDSYSSVDAGLVTPVKNQGQCGSCTAFATTAVVETCFKKLTGNFGDYSEQEFVDCAYGDKEPGVYGCEGAFIDGYFNWGTKKELIPSSESQYPYLNRKPKLSCPATMPEYDIGARMMKNSSYLTYRGDEELMKKLVFEQGAVVSTVQAAGEFGSYRGGVFSGCTGKRQDHAITVVGYGTENGKDYWLIKNSWGTNWGEKGYIKLERGVNMCGIGKHISLADCSKTVENPTTTTAAPTSEPCFDKYSNCADYISYCDSWSVMKTGCKVTCGTCGGAAPEECKDKKKNCDKIASKCGKKRVQKKCKKTCGLC